MKKFLSFLLSLMVSISAMAFDFTGKTFRGTETVDGAKVTITYRFKANNRASATLAISGQRPYNDNIYWEVSGGYINIVDSTGDYGYMLIDEEEGKTILIAFDSYGNEAMRFYQVAASQSTSKPRTPKKKKR